MAKSRDGYISTSAVLSNCGNYRYCLERVWGQKNDRMLIIGLNPSTADQTKDDATIRRCVDFAKRLGYSGLLMANLFGVRSTNPDFLKNFPDPVGPENNKWIEDLYNQSSLAVAAWGNGGQLFDRSTYVRALVPNLYCFGITKKGEPKHPLYLAATTKLKLFSNI